MPFLGSVTLAHACVSCAGRNALPDSGKGIVSTLPGGRRVEPGCLPASSRSALELTESMG